jgi:hypothetical protein
LSCACAELRASAIDKTVAAAVARVNIAGCVKFILSSLREP